MINNNQKERVTLKSLNKCLFRIPNLYYSVHPLHRSYHAIGDDVDFGNPQKAYHVFYEKRKRQHISGLFVVLTERLYYSPLPFFRPYRDAVLSSAKRLSAAPAESVTPSLLVTLEDPKSK